MEVAVSPIATHDDFMSEYTCPKCHGVMRSYERNGVHIEQCTDCRGLFLDRGELEHLVAAEASWSAAPPAPPAPPQQQYSQQQYSQKPYYKRKKNFFEELFD